jgi:hypothetical protein
MFLVVDVTVSDQTGANVTGVTQPSLRELNRGNQSIVFVCLCVEATWFQGVVCVKLAMAIATSFPPNESSSYVLPGSTTPLVTMEMLSEGGSNGFHTAWIP